MYVSVKMNTWAGFNHEGFEYSPSDLNRWFESGRYLKNTERYGAVETKSCWLPPTALDQQVKDGEKWINWTSTTCFEEITETGF